MKLRLFVFVICVATLTSYSQTNSSVIVKVNQPVAQIPATLWGVFFEDINFGADGGIYAELVKNRSFEFFKPMMGWTVQQKKFTEGAIQVLHRQGTNLSNPRFLRVALNKAVKGDIGITNEGFRGMGIKKDLRYDFSVLFQTAGNDIKLYIELLNAKNEIIGSSSMNLKAGTNDWQKQSVGFVANATDSKAKLNIWFEGNGTVDLDMISLFPEDTWKKRPGGMRADMIQLLADMKPGFIRFPGGCIVEGFDLSQRYQWKKTIGPVEDRQLVINRWNFEFAHRPAPDYFQTFGLGFFEYFQLAEDIGAEPLPILNCGMACQFNSSELVPVGELDPYVQDALDLIEFANGDVSTTWGKQRAALGHPAPFNLKMLGIGNENWGPQYLERLKIFTKAIKEKYPAIRLVNSSGTGPDGDRFDLLNSELRKMNADIIDEHYYRSPEWFLQNAARYDNYDRNGPKIFAGEYAAHADKTVSPENKNNWYAALSEAAFMTGLERNAGVVSMASYAPLFAHAEGWQWTPDLIWVDNLHAYGSPNYQVQKLYSLNKGTSVVPALRNNLPLSGQDSLYLSAVIDAGTKEVIIKVANVSAKAQNVNIEIAGAKKIGGSATVMVMKSDDLKAVNSFDNPDKISPQQTTLPLKGKNLKLPLAAYSFNVVKIKI